jgi:AcrR family transcriptional regulator
MTDRSVSMNAVARQARDAQHEHRRDSILSAAREVFSRLGFAAATVEDVAEQAGIGKGTLYLYFRSKEEIYLACLVEEAHKLMRQTREELSRAGDFRAKLRAFFRIRFEFCEKHEAFYRIYQAQYSTLFTKAHAIPKELRQMVSKSLDFVTGVIEEAIEAGEIRKVPARSAAGAILDIARGIADKRLLGFSSLSPGEELEFLVDFVWHALAGPSAALAGTKRKRRAGTA